MPADPLLTLDHSSPIVTIQGHLLAEQARIPGSTGTLSWILSAMSISAKIIANKVRCARLEDVLGEAGSGNVQGEQQQKLDVISNNVLLRLLGGREGVAIVASEENEEPVIIRDDPSGEHRYCVLFDPLDGSSNLDVCGGVGTIFSILRHDPEVNDAPGALLQPGRQQVAARVIVAGREQQQMEPATQRFASQDQDGLGEAGNGAPTTQGHRINEPQQMVRQHRILTEDVFEVVRVGIIGHQLQQAQCAGP